MPEHWALGDALASILTPDFGSVAALPWDALPYPKRMEDFDNADDVALGEMQRNAQSLFHTGIDGLSTRTYFGPNYIEQFGRELLAGDPRARDRA
jgi:hypothetical protein